jgi:hypothetical protein
MIILHKHLRWTGAALAVALLLGATTAEAATTVVYTQDFGSFSPAVTSLEDQANANPPAPEFTATDDTPFAGAGDAGAGVQVIDWLAKSGSKALLIRSASEVVVNLHDARSGPTATLDFWLYVVKGAGDRSFYVIVRSMGADSNAEDLLAYRSDRGATPAVFTYDGIGAGPGWRNTSATHAEGAWQQHRMVFNLAAQTFDLFIDNLETPVLTGGELSRTGASVITGIVLRHEGNSADDGYFVMDDLTLSVDGAVSLGTTFTEGFESYPARADEADDADPAGPWITTEAIGTGDGRELAPAKVQVVGASVVPPHSGNRCLKIEGGQRAGVSLAWGLPPQADVQITWWARVPASIPAVGEYNYLRMSLYGAEDGRTDQGDAALLGYGARSATVGDETSLTYYTTQWYDTGADYTPDTWEEYRLTTHNAQGRYSILKNPTSANPVVVVDRAAYIGTALNWGPMLVAAWSSSNGTDHPPVYVDDIEIVSLVSNPDPLPEPYTVTLHGDRFTNHTVLTVSGPVGAAAVDPRDNRTILFTMDAPAGGIYRALRTASGTWTVEEEPIVSGLDRPSGLAVAADGTLWWTHDYTQALVRLPTPWNSNTPEVVIANFGSEATDDDPIDLTWVPASFSGSLGGPGLLAVADRGVDGDSFNTIYLVDPTTSELNQTTYTRFLVQPTTSDIGSGNLNRITPLPQRGEVVTVSEDGWLTAVNGEGVLRYIWPATLWADLLGSTPSGAAVAADPLTGRLWVADDLLDELWSVDSDPALSPAPDRQEASFTLTNPTRPDLQLDLHDPTLAFAPDGAFLVLTDTSTANGGGRLIILHNETIEPGQPYSVTRVVRSAVGVELAWGEAAPGVTYRVLRGTEITNPAGFTDISGALTVREFTDSAPPAGQAFYRIQSIE